MRNYYEFESKTYSIDCDMCKNTIESNIDLEHLEMVESGDTIVRLSPNVRQQIGLDIKHLCTVCAGYVISRLLKVVLECRPPDLDLFGDVFDGSR